MLMRACMCKQTSEMFADIAAWKKKKRKSLFMNMFVSACCVSAFAWDNIPSPLCWQLFGEKSLIFFSKPSTVWSRVPLLLYCAESYYRKTSSDLAVLNNFPSFNYDSFKRRHKSMLCGGKKTTTTRKSNNFK